MIQIKNRFTGEVICEGETVAKAAAANLRYANLRSANLRYADLRSADLSYANLHSANLHSADLHSADLHSANLCSADLSSADLRSANLHYANLRYANLSYADLRSADLRSADLSYANLRYANLSKIRIAYQSHDLLAEILKRSAGDDIAKLKVAGLILISRDKCWEGFLDMAEHEPLADWALDELAKWVQPGDEAPKILRKRAAANEAVLGGGK